MRHFCERCGEPTGADEFNVCPSCKPHINYDPPPPEVPESFDSTPPENECQVCGAPSVGDFCMTHNNPVLGDRFQWLRELKDNG